MAHGATIGTPHELEGDVVAGWRPLAPTGIEHDEIRPLADLDRPEVVPTPDGLGPANGRQFEGEMGAGHGGIGVGVLGQAGEQRGRPQHVDLVTRVLAVAAEGDAAPRSRTAMAIRSAPPAT